MLFVPRLRTNGVGPGAGGIASKRAEKDRARARHKKITNSQFTMNNYNGCVGLSA